MTVLLSLIEKDAASHEKLQDIGKQLLAIRTKVNTEITRMIMLREATGTVRIRKDDCDCGILNEVYDGLENIINEGGDKDEGAEDDAEVDGKWGSDNLGVKLMSIKAPLPIKSPKMLVGQRNLLASRRLIVQSLRYVKRVPS